MPIYGKGYIPWSKNLINDSNCGNIPSLQGIYSGPINTFYANNPKISLNIDNTKSLSINGISNKNSGYLEDDENGTNLYITAADQLRSWNNVEFFSSTPISTCKPEVLGFYIYGDGLPRDGVFASPVPRAHAPKQLNYLTQYTQIPLFTIFNDLRSWKDKSSEGSSFTNLLNAGIKKVLLGDGFLILLGYNGQIWTISNYVPINTTMFYDAAFRTFVYEPPEKRMKAISGLGHDTFKEQVVSLPLDPAFNNPIYSVSSANLSNYVQNIYTGTTGSSITFEARANTYEPNRIVLYNQTLNIGNSFEEYKGDTHLFSEASNFASTVNTKLGLGPCYGPPGAYVKDLDTAEKIAQAYGYRAVVKAAGTGSYPNTNTNALMKKWNKAANSWVCVSPFQNKTFTWTANANNWNPNSLTNSPGDSSYQDDDGFYIIWKKTGIIFNGDDIVSVSASGSISSTVLGRSVIPVKAGPNGISASDTRLKLYGAIVLNNGNTSDMFPLGASGAKQLANSGSQGELWLGVKTTSRTWSGSYNITVQNCPIYDHMTGITLIGSDYSWKNIYNVGDTIFAKDQSDAIYMWGLLEKDYSDTSRKWIDSPTKTDINAGVINHSQIDGISGDLLWGINKSNGLITIFADPEQSASDPTDPTGLTNPRISFRTQISLTSLFNANIFAKKIIPIYNDKNNFNGLIILDRFGKLYAYPGIFRKLLRRKSDGSIIYYWGIGSFSNTSFKLMSSANLGITDISLSYGDNGEFCIDAAAIALPAPDSYKTIYRYSDITAISSKETQLNHNFGKSITVNEMIIGNSSSNHSFIHDHKYFYDYYDPQPNLSFGTDSSIAKPFSILIANSNIPLPSPTPTTTPTISNSQTPTPTISNSSTRTPTPTISNSSTQTPTPTISNSSTRTPTPTVSNSQTPSQSPTATPPVTPTRTPSQTPTSSETPTVTPTNTKTPSQTPTESPTVTPTQTPTQSQTGTQTPTVSNSQTPTKTPTNSRTPTPTISNSQTPTPTISKSATPTPTISNSATPTPTVSDSQTPTPSPTATLTPFLSATPTQTQTPTQSQTQTQSPTQSQTPTQTPTETPTPTNTITNTVTRTGTVTPTTTPTTTPSNTVTSSPTPTQTITKTPTGTIPTGEHLYFWGKNVNTDKTGNSYKLIPDNRSLVQYAQQPKIESLLENLSFSKVLALSIGENLSLSFGISSEGYLYGWGGSDDPDSDIYTENMYPKLIRALSGQPIIDINYGQLGSSNNYVLYVLVKFSPTNNTIYQLPIGNNSASLGKEATIDTMALSAMNAIVNLTDSVVTRRVYCLINKNNKYLREVVGNVPTSIGTIGINSIGFGQNHTMAITSDGFLWARGLNEGRFGDNNAITSSVNFVKVGVDNNWSKLVVGHNHTLAIKKDGSLWAWGFNNQGQLGCNDYISRYIPTNIPEDWREVYIFDGNIGQNISYGIQGDGSVWYWGAGIGNSPRLLDNSYDYASFSFSARSFDPTPTPTSSVTPSNTPTNTQTGTATPTQTPSETPTNTPTSSETPTTTPTNTPTNSETPTNTPTNSVTPSNTPTISNSQTITPTNSITPTVSPTNTVTPGLTATATETPTPTPSQTPTNSVTPTNTATPSNTPTNSKTPTNTPTNTVTPSKTPTNTPTNTKTPTYTPTQTITPSNTRTPTPSPRVIEKLILSQITRSAVLGVSNKQSFAQSFVAPQSGRLSKIEVEFVGSYSGQGILEVYESSIDSILTKDPLYSATVSVNANNNFNLTAWIIPSGTDIFLSQNGTYTFKFIPVSDMPEIYGLVISTKDKYNGGLFCSFDETNIVAISKLNSGTNVSVNIDPTTDFGSITNLVFNNVSSNSYSIIKSISSENMMKYIGLGTNGLEENNIVNSYDLYTTDSILSTPISATISITGLITEEDFNKLRIGYVNDFGLLYDITSSRNYTDKTITGSMPKPGKIVILPISDGITPTPTVSASSTPTITPTNTPSTTTTRTPTPTKL